MNLPENATREILTQGASEDVSPAARPIAPVIHTIILVAVLIGFSFLGAGAQHTFTHRHGRIVLYASTIIWEWLLVGYVVLGIRRRGLKLRDLIAGRWLVDKFWPSVWKFVTDFGIAIGFWLCALLVLAALGFVLGLNHPNMAAEAKAKLGFIVPATLPELALFLALSATAGFCEEVIFRGYLQRQFAALTRNQWIAVVLQAVVFGAGHGYEGGTRMLLIAAYGAMFGLLAMWRKSLRPGMIAHGLHDGIEGVVLYVTKFLR